MQQGVNPMQQGINGDIDTLGRKLSLVLKCGVRWPGHDKNIFVCNCGIPFPVYRLRASGDWSWAAKEHEKGGGN